MGKMIQAKGWTIQLDQPVFDLICFSGKSWHETKLKKTHF
jgi:hypothetical protein